MPICLLPTNYEVTKFMRQKQLDNSLRKLNGQDKVVAFFFIYIFPLSSSLIFIGPEGRIFFNLF